jgi:geranylgeranyl reductase family protein
MLSAPGWYDVAVVGAGPAGATLARLLAEAGARVVLLERAHLPRYKPCGGGLTQRAWRLLPAEARSAVRLISPGAEVVFGRWRLQVRTCAPAVGLVLRDEFDHCLVQLAAGAGAEVRQAAPVRSARLLPGAGGVELVAGDSAVRCRYLACADGATGPFSGPLGAAVGLAAVPRRIAALEVELEDPGAGWGPCLRGDFDLVPDGYGWVFPKAGVLSVGVASWRHGLGGATLRRALEQYLRRLGLQERRVLRRHGHAIPVGGTLAPGALAAPCAVRLGDAAGLADPLFGEGIAHAIHSAHLAAAPLLCGDPSAYVRAVRQRLYPHFRWAAVLARVFYPRPAPWFAAVARWPALGDWFFRLAVSERPG